MVQNAAEGKKVRNRPFAVYDHMTQKPPCWRANCPLGHPKQKNIKLSFFVLDVPVGSLLSSMAVFVPCDRKLQRAYFNAEQGLYCNKLVYLTSRITALGRMQH